MTTTDITRELMTMVWIFVKTLLVSLVTAFAVMLTMNGQFPDMSYGEFWQWTWAGILIVNAGVGVYHYTERHRDR